MTPIYYDPACDEYERRSLMYRGALVVLSPNGETGELCAFARELLYDAFEGAHPTTAQHEMPIEEFASVIADAKARFLHHSRSKELVRDVLSSLGCDLDRTHFDLPRLRTSRSDDSVTIGVADAAPAPAQPHRPVRGLHRDTWFSAPMAQINFWLPVFAVEPNNGMAFHIGYFDKPVSNSSATYDHYVWNKTRRIADKASIEKLNKEASRGLPKSLEQVEMARTVAIVPSVGGVINFSGQHLHSSMVNHSGRTRYSIDFRTVNVDDAIAGRSAPNVDASCTGSAFADFIRASDFGEMPDELVKLFIDATETAGQPLPLAE